MQPKFGNRSFPSDPLRENLDALEVPNMTSMMGMMQSMAQTAEQMAQLIPTLVQSARQITHHNWGNADAIEENKYFRAFKRWDPEVFEGNFKDLVVAEL